MEQQRELTDKRTSNDLLIRNMKQHIESQKQEKMRLLKRMKEKDIQTREKEVARDQEINKLKRKERQNNELAKKLEKHNHMQVT